MEGEGISESQEREQMTRGLPGEGGRWRGDWLCSTPEKQPSLCTTVRVTPL